MDLVDKNDKVIGTINQAEAPNLLETKAGFIRGATAFIQNDKGKIWVPRRTAHKRITPNGLDFSVAEHVQRGETYEQAVVRGFKEELFLDIKNSDLKYLGKLEPLPQAPYFFTGVFLYNANAVKEYNRTDFTGFEWLSPHEVIKRIDNGDICKNTLKPAVLTFIKAI